MILIIILHILGGGGVLNAAAKHRAQFSAGWVLETIGYCAVNCYALISGFVNRSKEFKLSRIVEMWLEVMFWLLLPLGVLVVFYPTEPIALEHLIGSLFPVTMKTYWYFNGFLLLAAFSPIVNIGLEKIGRKAHLTICIFLFATTSVLRIFYGGENFALGSGYSGMWILILYVIGAYFRIYGIPKWAKWYVTLPAFLFTTFAAFAMEMHKVDLTSAKLITANSGIWSSLGQFVEYTSPFMVIMALCLLFLFANVRIKPKFLRKLIILMGSCSFGVYLIHVGPLTWKYFMVKQFKVFGTLPWWGLVLAVIGTAIGLFILYDFMSVGRMLLFKACKKGLSKWIARIKEKKERKKAEKTEEIVAEKTEETEKKLEEETEQTSEEGGHAY